MKKRYNSFVGYYKSKYGSRLQKIVIDAGFTCPNRDGSIAFGGCTYCDNNAFHPSYSTPDKSIMQQMEEGMEFHRRRYRTADSYIAYFQPYSNTYAPLERLKELYAEALSHPDVVGIAVGTRPDCVDEEKLDYLAELSREHIVMVEYGIESCFDATLERINRGHTFQHAAHAVKMTAERGLDVCAHFILGLPGESRDMMLESASVINSLPLTSLKFHQLQIIKGTRMEREFETHPEDFVTFSLGEYLDFFVDILERLRPEICIERFAGEVPPRFVKSTPWGLIRNVELLRLLEKRLEERDSWQGKLL
ncbi:MAG TPA: TIGR01212 family radical SAM protein [Bacteroidales bacterium]|jgi:radical SAM protein (TIGR01212 family)|nr:TIGR01212 family radical SAM protein [Bacteroidales bacterium]HKM13212.1 TIGR01212 family radical SAM protein [Bacteroidales bacterium]HPB89315.1 TIGR01212 family radical SAM protein [Bacteroidales bacterium]HQN23562.1 TIGR01212 family radical SAM protein [Bacteroidales bacterium]HQP78983.1 TIGR01212 family radical SAM protein [Bacteroidales bacterium]